MPFTPNVPHIVGDDDELNEAEDQTQLTNGANDVAYSSASCDYTDEECNVSGQEEYEEEEDEEEEEDWSNNISYIVRTPERVPDREKTPLASTDPVAEIDLTEDTQADNYHSDVSDDVPTHHVVESEEEDQSKSDVEVAPTEPDSPMTSHELDSPASPNQPDSPVVSNESASSKGSSEVVTNEPDSPVVSNDPESPVVPNDPYSPVSDEPMQSFTPPEKGLDVETLPIPKENEALVLNKTTSIQSMEESRRLSLRSAYRANQKKTELPSTKTIRGRSRQLKTKSKNDNEKSTAPPKTSGTSGARVAKRSRHAVVPSISSPIGNKSPEKLAKPLEVTEYFTRISAHLVSHRVNSVPFLYMRESIDRLVGEAIAKTKST